MSEQNVVLHRRANDAFNARDVEALIGLCDPSVELHSNFAAVPGGGVYHGPDGIRRWDQDLEDGFGDEIRVEAEAYFDLGDHTLAFILLHGRGRQSGAEVSLRAAQLLRWRDGLLVHFKGYVDREDALRDLGISEDALQPIAP
jgi:ketosteroid isomerase-like protein